MEVLSRKFADLNSITGTQKQRHEYTKLFSDLHTQAMQNYPIHIHYKHTHSNNFQTKKDSETTKTGLNLKLKSQVS